MSLVKEKSTICKSVNAFSGMKDEFEEIGKKIVKERSQTKSLRV